MTSHVPVTEPATRRFALFAAEAASVGRTLPGRPADKLIDTVLGLREGGTARDLGRVLRELLDETDGNLR
jgi:hypothetical protein